MLEATICEIRLEPGGGDERRTGGGVETAQEPVAQCDRHAGARMNILREAGVERCCERHAARKAITTRAPAERSLGRDMDSVWREALDVADEPPARRESQDKRRCDRIRG